MLLIMQIQQYDLDRRGAVFGPTIINNIKKQFTARGINLITLLFITARWSIKMQFQLFLSVLYHVNKFYRKPKKVPFEYYIYPGLLSSDKVQENISLELRPTPRFPASLLQCWL